MRYAQIVVGPAGSGKSTYCAMMNKHGAARNREIVIINFDAEAKHSYYETDKDLRHLDELYEMDASDELKSNPNGKLLYFLEFLDWNTDWTDELLGDVSYDDDYVVFDCPSKIDNTYLPEIVKIVDQCHFDHICVIFLLDAQTIALGDTYIAGLMEPWNEMKSLEVPHVKILTKMDLLPDENNMNEEQKKLLSNMMSGDCEWLQKFSNKTEASGSSTAKFHPLNSNDGKSIDDVLLTIDNILHFYDGDNLANKVCELSMS